MNTTTTRTGELSIDAIACAEDATNRIPFCWIIEVVTQSATDNKGARLACDLMTRPGHRRWIRARDYAYSLSTDARHLAEDAMKAMAPNAWASGSVQLVARYAMPGGNAYVFTDR